MSERSGSAPVPDPDAAPEQLSLAGLPEPPPAPKKSDLPVGAEGPAPEDPIAKVLLDAYVPHLDRVFDYRVSAGLDRDAVVGAKVSVPFSGRLMTGWIVDRVAESEVTGRLLTIRKVLSPLPVLKPVIVELAQAVAARSAGTVSDVLRVAVPPRVARVDKEMLARRQAAAVEEPESTPVSEDTSGDEGTAEVAHGETDTGELARADTEVAKAASAVDNAAEDAVSSDAEKREPAESARDEPDAPVTVPRKLWRYYNGGLEWLAAASEGDPARAVVEVLPAPEDHDWALLTASAMAATYEAGHGALAVVSDYKSLERLAAALESLVGSDRVVRLHADDGPTPRYRGYMELSLGYKRLAIGTRSAAYAPVQDLRLVCCHDDGDTSYVEQRAPYQHTRDVLLLRAQQENTAALFTGYSVSPEAQRLITTGWAAHVRPERATLRKYSPRVEATSDSFNLSRDPMAARARLPHEAFRVAQQALAQGPVLVQVARRGYAPFVACERCRTPARCRGCGGSLSLRSGREAPVCTWCGRNAHGWQCQECGHQRLRLSKVGALRTAEELGRAFPQVPVISSSAEHVRPDVGSDPALVVATPGAEPVAEGGYAAALLLDGNEMLARPWLRAEEQTLRRWFNAAALVRSSSQGGTVVVTADHDQAVGALVRWDPSGHAYRQLQERHELGLPPAVRTAALTGPRDALTATLRDLDLPPQVNVVGPAPMKDQVGGWSDEGDPGTLAGFTTEDEPQYRALLFFGFGIAPQITAALRAEKARASALREHAVVNVRCDITDLL
ncbi:primosomal protein N' [Kocuria atrinae]|uniref:Probable replication restart protein PriA n=1 Tax=Kocuria atrinae TaxID=592377 RepID=A0ABN2XUX7_9MICC